MATATKSKAGDFADYAQAAGWEVERKIDGDVKTVLAHRGDENINASWRNDAACDKWYHIFPGGQVSVKNAAHAKRIVDMKPGEAAAAAPVKKRRAPGEKRTAPTRKLALDPALATDAEVLEAVRGHRITWSNQFTDITESAVVPPNGKKTRIDSDDADLKEDPTMRVLTFCDAEGEGYRSLRLGALLRIGRIEA